MRGRSFALLVPLFALSALAPACSQTPVVVPLRSMERPRDVDYICLEGKTDGSWAGASLEKCALLPDGNPAGNGAFRLHAVVTQTSRGELAVVDLGTKPNDAAALLKVDPRIPGYSFIPTVAAPVDVAADPMGSVVFVAGGRDPRIDVIPAGLLRGPIDTTAATMDPPPWPHIDFDRTNDGIPGSMAIVREGDTRRLYVTLPEAKGGAKIAVFAIGTSVVPAFVGFIPLSAGSAPPLPWKPIACGQQGSTVTWWSSYDVCAGETPRIPKGQTTAPDTVDMHLAGTAVAAGKLFVADDRAPFVHVFSVRNNSGVEEARISIGSPTSRVAVSPVMPDEVTLANFKAIDLCVARGWLGDGLDHTADSSIVATQLKGRCRAHRYLYAIDLVNAEAGNGTMAIVDLPVVYVRTGTTTAETLDLAGAELVQPMACDAPTFPPRRLPLGPFAVNAINTVPARSISFVQYDPPTNAAFVPAARCRPYAPSSDELAGVPEDQRAARIAAGEYWRTGISTTRMRGVFGWVALENGAVVAVDMDDYDGLCRGPRDDTSEANLAILHHPEDGTFKGFAEGGRTGEYYPRPVLRHHVRSLRPFNTDTMSPVVSAATLSRFGTAVSNDPANENSRRYPHFAALVETTGSDRPPVVLPAPDNPYSIVTETWSAVYEGPLPGFGGAFGNLQQEGGSLTLSDATIGFCRRGIETRGALETHDVVQLTDPVCAIAGSCTGDQQAKCLATFGAADAQPLAKERSLIVEKSFDGKLVLANKQFKRVAGGTEDYTLVDGAPNLTDIKTCFGTGLLRYTVRANGIAAGSSPWVVIGSGTGYTHRWIVDPAADPKSTDKACVLDATKPRIMDSRASEAPPLKDFSGDPLRANVVEDSCLRFINQSWQFAIRQGTQPSRQDMVFTFGGRFAWQPLSIGAGSLAASMRPVSAWWDGTEHLGWNMIGVVDAIDRGLFLFPANEPFTFQKAVN